MKVEQIDERHVVQERYGGNFVVFVYDGGGEDRSWAVDSLLITDAYLPEVLRWLRDHLPADNCWSLGAVEHPEAPTAETDLVISWIVGADVLNASEPVEPAIAAEMLARRHRVSLLD